MTARKGALEVVGEQVQRDALSRRLSVKDSGTGSLQYILRK